jgi:uncharacterized lipoprotein YmbA
MLKRFRGVRVLALLLLIVVPLALTACGGNSKKDTYKKDAQKIAKQVQADSTAAQSSFQGVTSPDQLVTAFNSYKTKLDKSINDFDNLKPPDNIKAEHDKFVTDLKALSDDISKAVSALKTQDQTALQSLQTKVQADSAALTASASALDNKLK